MLPNEYVVERMKEWPTAVEQNEEASVGKNQKVPTTPDTVDLTTFFIT